MPETKKKRKFIQRIRLKYRLKVIDEGNYEEKVSLRLSLLNLFVIFGSITMLMIIITIYMVAFTSLREFIPGYADTSVKQEMYDLMLKTDSLEKVITAQDIYLTNLSIVLQGREPIDSFSSIRDTTLAFEHIRNQKSEKDSALRKAVAEADAYNINPRLNDKNLSPMSRFLFFPPLNGQITEKYDPALRHYGIDIVSPRNEAVKATLGGTIIFTGWTSETGYIIAVQHEENLVSIYKHNASLLKTDGNFVRTGEPIAIVGNSGKYTTGPHLHFEIWYNGRPLNPEELMVF